MSQLPTANGTPGGIPPRRMVPPSPGGSHPHGHLNHSHSHSSNPPMIRNHGHNHGHMHSELDSASLSSSRFDIDWEAKERELEEARARAAQMEKTMRWWSDCTANWREKWSKVRTERNKAREESKVLRTKLEMALKDCSSIRREKQAVENENEFLRSELERLQQDSQLSFNQIVSDQILSEKSRIGTPELSEECPVKPCSPVKSEDSSSPVSALSPRAHLASLSLQKEPDRKGTINGFVDIDETFGAIPKQKANSRSDYELNDERSASLNEERNSPSRRSCSNSDYYSNQEVPMGPSQASLTDPIKFLESLEAHDVEYLQQKLTSLKLRLDEATKTIQAEREEKSSLHRAMEQLQMELLELRGRVEELKRTKQDTERQLILAQEQHRQQIISLQQDCREEANTRETLDRRLAELRSELERLQTENAAEWGRRERVETERQALERDNKKLRAALADSQERLEKRNTCSRGLGGSAAVSGGSGGSRELENQQVQAELEDKNKELIELRHAHNKLKKALQDKSVELSHGLRRAEHSEAEVRRLRARIDELKREVAAAQDELDAATNNVRKLQRTNEELQEQSESLQMQINHLQTRLRSSGSFLSHRESLLQDTLSEDDGNEY